MLTVDVTMRLDEMLKRYHEMGRKKRTRIMSMISEYVPQDRIERVLDRSMVKE